MSRCKPLSSDAMLSQLELREPGNSASGGGRLVKAGRCADPVGRRRAPKVGRSKWQNPTVEAAADSQA